MIVKQRSLLYKPSMVQKTYKGIDVHTISPEPGIHIWYCKIHHIIHSVFSNGNYHNFRVGVNKLFKKDNFKHPFLSTLEFKTLNDFKSLKKQIEWVCGRYLLKLMFTILTRQNIDFKKVTLGYHELGAPFFRNMPDLPISLSHSNEYTVAAICDNKEKTIGIDMEEIRADPSMQFLNIAFTPKEIQSMNSNAEDIFKNWTIKEAYLKYIKKGFNESLHHVEVINNEIFHNQNPLDLKIYSKIIDDKYALSLVFD